MHLDDRISWVRADPGLTGDRMMHGPYIIAAMQTALGIYQAESKSDWSPHTEIIFLGFVINSLTMTISVEPGKYQVLCEEIQDFLAGETFHDVVLPDGTTKRRIVSYCGKKLERLRGKSWVLVQN